MALQQLDTLEVVSVGGVIQTVVRLQKRTRWVLEVSFRKMLPEIWSGHGKVRETEENTCFINCVPRNILIIVT